jgi:hypothetical protein
MPLQEFTYKDQKIQISSGDQESRLTINGIDIPVNLIRDKFDSLDYAGFYLAPSLQDLAKYIIDNQLHPRQSLQ